MSKLFVTLASICTGLALLLPTQGQTYQSVDAGGVRLRMQILGKGAPAVVFDTGGGGSLEGWGRVPSEISKLTTTVAYDRAGNGASDPATTPRDGHHVAAELHLALRNAGVAPPYLLVGHSIGGPYMRVFAGMYPREVAGLVLVDPTQEEMVSWDREHGMGRSGSAACSAASELDCDALILEQAHSSPIPGDIPVFLIHVRNASGALNFEFQSPQLRSEIRQLRSRTPFRLQFHKAWVDRLPGGHLIIAENSSHGGINFEEPELVIQTIRQALRGAH